MASESRNFTLKLTGRAKCFFYRENSVKKKALKSDQNDFFCEKKYFLRPKKKALKSDQNDF